MIELGATGRHARLALVLCGLAVAVVLAPAWPSERRVRYVLGDHAGEIEELEVRWTDQAEGPSRRAELYATRFHFEHGKAPRVVEQEIRLKDGTYSVDVDLVSSGPRARRSVVRSATLTSRFLTVPPPVSIDLATDVRAAHDVKSDRPTATLP